MATRKAGMGHSTICMSILAIHWKMNKSQPQWIQHFNSSFVCNSSTDSLICNIEKLPERQLWLYECLSKVPLLKLRACFLFAFIFFLLTHYSLPQTTLNSFIINVIRCHRLPLNLTYVCINHKLAFSSYCVHCCHMST